MTETDTHAEDCPRCGSLLPEEEEGLCPTCGYEFGRATLYMPVVRLDEDGEPETASEDAEPSLSDAPADPVFSPQSPQKSPSGRLIIMAVVIVTVVAVLVIGLGAMFAIYGGLLPAPNDAPTIENTGEPLPAQGAPSDESAE